MHTMTTGPLPLPPVENPLAEYSQSIRRCFETLLARSEVEAEHDISTIEQANLLRYLDCPAQKPQEVLRTKIQALLPQLKPVAHIFMDDVREELLKQDCAIIEASLTPLTAVRDAIHESLPWATLEPRVLLPLERLKVYYETAFHELMNGTQEARIKWLTWKAQISVPIVGHYLISVVAAQQILCRDALGKTVKHNDEGNHAVIFRDGLVFKPNPQVDEQADPIEPGMELAVVAWHQLLSNSEESAASTEIIKLRQVPFKTAEGRTFLDGGVVQCGLMIYGILLQDMLALQETIQHWVNTLGEPSVETLLPQILTDIEAIHTQDAAKQQSTLLTFEATIKQHIPDFEAKQMQPTIDQILRAFCVYNLSFPPDQRLKEFDTSLNDPQWLLSMIDYIQRKGGLLILVFAFVWCVRYPGLMRGQSLNDVLGWAESLKVLFKLCPKLSPKDQMAVSMNWSQQLNRDNITALVLASLLTFPTDGKGDNYMVTFHFDATSHKPLDFKIIGIDNDRALLSGDVPSVGISCRPGIGKDAPPVYWPDLKCVLFVLPCLLALPVSPGVVNHLLSKTPLQWNEAWLSSILYKTQQWQEWQALNIVMPEDSAIGRIKRLDIPVNLPPALMDGLLSRLENMQRLCRASRDTTLTIKDAFFALEPILARYYETLMQRFPHRPLKAYEYIHYAYKRGYNTEIKLTLREKLQETVSSLAVLATSPSLLPPITLEALLKTYSVQEKRHVMVPINHLANHLAKSPRGSFSPETFPHKTQGQTMLLALENLGRLGATHTNFSLEGLTGTALVQSIHQAVQLVLPGALRLLLLERAHRLSMSLEDSEGLYVLRYLHDSRGRTLWHVFFNTLSAANDASTAEHVTNLLAHFLAHQVNVRDTAGHLPIFTLVRKIAIVPEQAEMALSRLVALGVDFTLSEKIGKATGDDETPLDHAMRLCLDRPNKPPFNVVTLLLRYGAGHAISLNIAQAFFEQFRKEPVIEKALKHLKQQNRVFAWQMALHTLTDPFNIHPVQDDSWLIEGAKTGKRYLAPEIVARIKQTQIKLPSPTELRAVEPKPINPTNAADRSPPKDSSLSSKLKRRFHISPPSSVVVTTPPTQEEHYGYHAVLPLHYRGERAHLKILPELPGFECAVGSIYRHFFNYGLPETELFRFPSVIKGQALAVLFSQTIGGENLHDVLKDKDATAKLSQLDVGRFTELLIMHLLTNPEDGKADNYQLVSFINTQGQKRYALIPVDNDHAFVDAFRVETDKVTGDPVRILQIKTIIYCLDAMLWPLDTTVIQKFVNLSIAQKLTAWLMEMVHAEYAFNQLFPNQKERKHLFKNPTHPVIIGVPFAPKKIASLYDKARKLQELFQKALQTHKNHPTQAMLSGLDVLKLLEPTLGHYYENAFIHTDTPQTRFYHLTKDLYTVGAFGQSQTMLSGVNLLHTQNITESGMLGQDERYSPVQALLELEQVQKEYLQLITIRSAVQEGNINALDTLLLDKHKQQMILELDLTKLSAKTQQTLWKYLTNKKTAISFEKLHIQGSEGKPIHTLTDDLLKKLLSYSPHLRELRLAHCSQISESSLKKLALFCPSLISLTLTQLPTLNYLDTKKRKKAEQLNPGLLLPLEKLEIKDCASLKLININAAPLIKLVILHTPTLYYCRTHSSQLKYLRLEHSNLASISQWRALTSEQAYLTINKISIEENIIDLPFFVDLIRAFPILLSLNEEIYKNPDVSKGIKNLLELFITLKTDHTSLTSEQKRAFVNIVTEMLTESTDFDKIYQILYLIDGFKILLTKLNPEDKNSLLTTFIITLEEIKKLNRSELFVQTLLRALQDANQEVHAVAASALGELSQAKYTVVQTLLQTLKNTNDEVFHATVGALIKLGRANPAIIPTLLKTLGGKNPYARCATVIVLGDLKQHSPEYIQLLLKALADPDRGVRDTSIEALLKLGHEHPAIIIPTLFEFFKNNNLISILVAIAGLLVKLGREDLEVIQVLQTALIDKQKNIRCAAAKAYGELKQISIAGIQDLLKTLADSERKVRTTTEAVLVTLAQNHPIVIQKLLKELENKKSKIRLAIIGVLIKLEHNNPDVIRALQKLLRDKELVDIRLSIAITLVKLGQENSKIIQILLNALENKEWKVRRTAVDQLAKVKEASFKVISALLKVLGDNEWQVCSAAAQTLVKLAEKTPTVIPELLNALETDDVKICIAIIDALKSLAECTPKVIHALLSVFDNVNNQIRAAVVSTLGTLKNTSPKVIKTLLLKAIEDSDAMVRAAAIDALGVCPEALEIYLKALEDSDRRVCAAAASVLAIMGPENLDLIPVLLTMLENTTDAGHFISLRVTILGILVKMGYKNPDIIQELLSVLRKTKNYIYVRSEAAITLGELKQANLEIIQALLMALEDKFEHVRTAAAGALVKLRLQNLNLFQATPLKGEDDKVPTANLEALLKQLHHKYFPTTSVVDNKPMVNSVDVQPESPFMPADTVNIRRARVLTRSNSQTFFKSKSAEDITVTMATQSAESTEEQQNQSSTRKSQELSS